jgi:chemotaxis protein CheD
MNNKNNKIDIFLLPGEFYFGDQDTRISTLLGSCIAITLWHPLKLIGGMCHFMLPSTPNRIDPQKLNGKYAEDATKMFLKEINSAGTLPSEYQAKIFGGGNMFSNLTDTPHCNANFGACTGTWPCKKIACKNALIAPYLLNKHGFNIISQDLGGTEHRKVIFEVWSGDVWQRKGG